jgi:hypothetical protein
MSREKHDDQCAGCLPVLLDTTTMQPLPPNSPQMKAIMLAWKETTLEEREAFHNVTCLNSRRKSDLITVANINLKFQAALSFMEERKCDIK